MPDNPLDRPRVVIDFQPLGRRVEVHVGTTLLEAAHQAGVRLASLCGGIGSCESCIVRVLSGDVSEPNSLEQDALDPQSLAAGLRQSCQARAFSDVKVDVPPESLGTSQRLQLESLIADIDLDPRVLHIDVQLDPASAQSLQSDSERLRSALAASKVPDPILRLPVVRQLSQVLRANDWSVRLALRGSDVLAILPPGTQPLGLAVDIGTTKLALYLLDLASGDILASIGEMNPQVAFGEDVINRIAYANTNAAGRQTLQVALLDTLNQMIADCCSSAGVAASHIVDAVMVGNTAMHHLFAGLSVSQLGLAPYVPSVSEAMDIEAHSLPIAMAPGGYVHLPPNIAGYVGGDHVAMLLASEIWNTRRNILALDIGTNTEITLASGGRLLTCSCASGPAFEGAHIRDGMRAAPGAIERVHILQDKIRIQTVGDQPAVGICGSGILDAVAQLLQAGALDHTGRMLADHPLIRQGNKHSEAVLVEGSQSGTGRDIAVTRKDVNEIQLAKAAIRAGLDVLLQAAEIEADTIDEIIIAGAFGTFLDVRSAIRVGMFPARPLSHFRQIGNAAGAGAIQMLLSGQRRHLALQLVDRIEYIELTNDPAFKDSYTKALHL
jgi:uncharacterized 2Fe-2S/4Fe-4S cluster protein (DUF4445 family)